MRAGGWGSAVVVVLVAAVLLRPWEELDGGGEERAAAWAEVVRAVDGDTIEVELDGERDDVRYIGVDTPESVQPGAPVECFGPQASAFNHRLVDGRRVWLVFGAERRDRYGRLLAYVYLRRPGAAAATPGEPASFVNAELLRRGLARQLTIPPNDRYAPRFGRLEMAAARAGRGLWGAC